MYEYKSNDGLCQSNNNEMIETWNKITEQQETAKKKYIAELRQKGIKALIPNDGWVNRTENYFQLVYPDFNDGVKIGDKVMLSFGKGYNERLVVVKNIKENMFGKEYYYFEDIKGEHI